MSLAQAAFYGIGAYATAIGMTSLGLGFFTTSILGIIINAVIAGSIVATLGEVSVYAFEQIYLGNKSLDDIDWIKKVVESKLSKSFVEKVNQIIEKLNDESVDYKTIANMIVKTFFSK